MLNSFSIRTKLLVAIVTMGVLITSYLVYSFVSLNISQQKLNGLKSLIHLEATYGTSLALMNNVNRREQLNKQYLVAQDENSREIITLLNAEFEQLLSEITTNSSTIDKQYLDELYLGNENYIQLLETSIWPTYRSLLAKLNKVNNDTSPLIEKLANDLRDKNLIDGNIDGADVNARLANHVLATRAYFNQYIANGSQTAYQRAKLELLATEFALKELHEKLPAGQQSYIQIFDDYYLQLTVQIEQIVQLKTQLDNYSILSAETSSGIAQQLISMQIKQWRNLNHETGEVLQFVSSFSYVSLGIMLFTLIIGGGLLIFISRQITTNLTTLICRVKEVANGGGDLTTAVTIDSKDETGKLGKSINAFISSIRTLIANAQNISLDVGQNAQKSLEMAESTGELLDKQMMRNTQVAISIEEMSVTTQSVAENASQANDSILEAFDSLKAGEKSIDDSVMQIMSMASKLSEAGQASEQLNQDTENVTRVLEVIKSMTDQTNLLALNAAIEAARAGEAGRGFAVVADEVRTLANGTQNSAREIEQTITQLQERSKNMVKLVASCNEDSNTTIENTHNIKTILSELRHSFAQVQSMSESISVALEQSANVANEVTKDSNEVAMLSKEANELAGNSLDVTRHALSSIQKLESALEQFKT